MHGRRDAGSGRQMIRPLHILVHDYAGHPFTADLSRGLAALGHRVDHAFFADDPGPKGQLTRQPTDPFNLAFHPVAINQPYSKSNFLIRRSGDLAYGRQLAKLVTDSRPDLVLSGNTPTEAQAALLRACTHAGARFVYWCQDFYAIAVDRILRRKLPGFGALIGAYYRHLERGQMRHADHLIHITDSFRPQSEAWGVPSERTSVVPNWGTINALPVMDRDTMWAEEQSLNRGNRYLYAGTLALKHDPTFLTALALSLPANDAVITTSAGIGADWLADLNDPRLNCLALQPIDRFAEVLASADVLLAMIEREAGTFSVPSKILSYLCAGRPIVLAAPDDNLAAQIIRGAGAGAVVAPEDRAGFIAAAKAFGADPALSAEVGARGRAYAEATFKLPTITRRFEAIFAQVMETHQ